MRGRAQLGRAGVVLPRGRLEEESDSVGPLVSDAFLQIFRSGVNGTSGVFSDPLREVRCSRCVPVVACPSPG